MGRLRLTLACGEYELTRPLISGEIQPDGIEFVPLTMKSPERHWRMIRHLEFDVCEFSLAQFFMVKAQGYLLPEFPSSPSKVPSWLYLHQHESRNQGTKDLEGKRVGQRIVQNTAACGCGNPSALLRRFPEGNRVDQPGRRNAAAAARAWVRNQESPSGTTSTTCCQGRFGSGHLPDHLPSFQKGNPAVGRLFPEVKKEEMKYYQDTGIFPIMHTVVIKQSLLDQYPWAARSLYHAFLKAKEICYRRMEDPRKIASHGWKSFRRAETRHGQGSVCLWIG